MTNQHQMPVGNTCPECGYMHPPTPPGECPMAKDKQIQESSEHLKSVKATTMMQAIQIKLLDRLKSLPEDKQEELSMMVFQLIDTYE
jgi:hypothetical protein